MPRRPADRRLWINAIITDGCYGVHLLIRLKAGPLLLFISERDLARKDKVMVYTVNGEMGMSQGACEEDSALHVTILFK